MSKIRAGAFALLLFAMPLYPAFAAGGGGGGGGGGDFSSAAPQPKDPNYVAAVDLINKGDFNGALPLLQKAMDANPKSADCYNYMGYVNRKLGHREAALALYTKALQLDPEHLGANEYLGELYLEMGDLPKAEERLSKLDDLCLFGCSQYTALKNAVKAYKAQAPKSS